MGERLTAYELEEFKDFLEKRVPKDGWVAIVEDVGDYAQFVARSLPAVTGFDKLTVQAFPTCESFVGAGNIKDFDVCFLDARFPPGKMSGIDAIPSIQSANQGITIIGISSEEDLVEDLKEYGAHFAMTKDKFTQALLDLIPDHN